MAHGCVCLYLILKGRGAVRPRLKRWGNLMARLSREEETLLKRLRSKQEAPDEPPIGKTLNIAIDLGDDKQVETARGLGLLDFITNGGDDDEPEPDGEPELEEGPRRQGYFRDK